MAINAGDILWIVDADTKQFEAAIGKISKSSAAVGKALTGIGVVGVAAIGGITGAAIKVAADVDKSSKKMVASLGLPSDVADDFSEKIKKVYGDNFGESIEDVGEKMTATFQQFSRVSDSIIDNIEEVTAATISISDAFDVDVNEAASAAATLMEQFGISSDKALDMVAAGFQRGLNAQGDFLDSIGEYSVQFSEAGASAEWFFGVMESGLSGGMLGTDKAADLFKEFRVRIQDGSKGVADALESIGIKSKDMLEGLADGSFTVAEAFIEVQEKLAGAENSAIQMQAGVALLGTQFEDLGATAALSMGSVRFELMQGVEGVSSLQEQYNNLGSALEGLKRKAILALEPLGKGLLDSINQNMPQITAAFDRLAEIGPLVASSIVPVFTRLLDVLLPVIESVVNFTAANPELVSTLFLVVGAVSSVLVVLGPLLIALPGLVSAFSAVAGIVPFVGAVIAALTGPIGLIIGAVVVAVALIVRNWEFLKQRTQSIFEMIKLIVLNTIDFIMNPVGTMIRIINNLINKINQLTGLNLGNIPGFAQGGVVPGYAQGGQIQGLAGGGLSRMRMVKVGERGPELAALPVGTRVLSHADMMRAVQQGAMMGGGMGSGGGGLGMNLTPVFNVTVNGYENPDMLLQKLKGPFSKWMAEEFRKSRR